MAVNPFINLSSAFSSSVDGAVDSIPFWQGSTSTDFWISRNTFLNLTSAPVGLTDSQTLTNKILTSPTISGPTLSGTITGTYTIGGTPTFPAAVATLTGSQTLTNKVLTSPTINAPTITNATISADTVSGFTTSNNGTIYGMSVTGGILASAALVNTVNTAAIQTNAITGPKLATSAILLGTASSTSNFTTASTTSVLVTGLTATVTIPAGGRSVKITGFTSGLYNNASAASVLLSIWDGTVGSGTQLAQATGFTSTGVSVGFVMAVVTPSAGSKTYSIGLKTSGAGTAAVDASATAPSLILVELI